MFLNDQFLLHLQCTPRFSIRDLLWLLIVAALADDGGSITTANMIHRPISSSADRLPSRCSRKLANLNTWIWYFQTSSKAHRSTQIALARLASRRAKAQLNFDSVCDTICEADSVASRLLILLL
jgi:hypothetical protein